MFIARQSDHIQEDIKRNWSSWNFGELGFKGTEEELNEAKNSAFENYKPFSISGFELWEDDIRKADIRELYSGYWVLVDNFNARHGLSCLELNTDNLEDAIVESQKLDYTGEGQSFNATEAILIKSIGDIHIFQLI